MKNHEIPSQIWKLRNEVIDKIDRYMSNSNNVHVDYKGDFAFGARSIKHICDNIEKLANQYVQPKE